jgi:hypothetical protein
MKLRHYLVKAAVVVVALWGAAVLPAQASDYAETAAAINAARANIAAAEKSIEEADKKVQQALGTIQNAETLEDPHWGVLEKSVQEWVAVMGQGATTIDSNARTILRLNPSTSVNLQSSAYFGMGMRALRDQLRGIQVDLRAAIARAEESRQRQSKVRLAALDDMKDGAVNLTQSTAFDVLGIPTSVGDGVGEVTVLAAEAAGKWFAKPIGLANTGIKFLVGFYYLADETKSNSRVIRSANELDAFAKDFVSRTQANISAAQQRIDIVTRLWQQGDDTRSKFNQAQNGWRKASEEAGKQQTAEASQKLDEELAKPGPKVQSGTYWPAPDTPPIESSEYQGEVQSILQELRSAAMAAIDGGSPLAYRDIKENHEKRMAERRKSAQTRFDATGKALQAASEISWAINNAAFRTYYACNNGCWQPDYAATRRCYDSCGTSLNAALRAATLSVVPAATAHSLSGRERVRLDLISGAVGTHSEALDQMIRAASNAATAQFDLLWAQHQKQFEALGSELNSSLAGIPGPHTLAYYRNQPQWAQWEINIWSHNNPGAARENILNRAQQIRDAGKDAKRGLVDYKKVLPQFVQAAQQAQSELTDFQTRFGPLMHGGHLYGDQANVDSNIAWVKKIVLDRFTFIEPDYLAAASSFPYEATAREVEARLGELDDVIHRIDTFNYRLSNVNTALDKASRALTKLPLYSNRGVEDDQLSVHSAAKMVQTELTSGPWIGFNNALQTLVRQGLDIRMDPTGYEDSPVKMLMMIQSALLNHLNSDNKWSSYVRAANQGRFAPADQDAYDKVAKIWQSLKPLYALHESAAAPERARLAGAQGLFPDEVNLHKAYATVPVAHRGMLQTRYFNYRNQSNWLRDYLTRMQSAAEPMGDPGKNQVMAKLQSLIEGYPAAKAEWERQQAEARALYERQMEEYRQRQAAEAAAQRAHAEQARQAEQAAISNVQKLYQDFASAYQARNLSGLLRYMTEDWKAADGSDLRDLEDILDNSFRVFDRVTFAITGLSIQAVQEGHYDVNYSATITGHINQMNIKHQETAQVQDTVVLTSTGPKIKTTRGGRIWLKQ